MSESAPLLNRGTTINIEGSTSVCIVDNRLGIGGQGEVYRAFLNGKVFALKWYFPRSLQYDTRLVDRLLYAVRSGAPNDRFLWPRALVLSRKLGGFGYLMDIREPRFAELSALLQKKVSPSFHTMITAGIELAHSYKELHARGMCYRDISFGNAFFDPQTGEVRICDNDNVDEDGKEGLILGTPRFLAPELIRGEASPSSRTDLYSLSVLLFYMLFRTHPLEGAMDLYAKYLDYKYRPNEPVWLKLQGLRPIFIFDPHDEANRPIDNLPIRYWNLYPRFLKVAFTRAFTEGLHKPDQRLREGEWRSILIRLRDAIFYCHNCGAENFYDIDVMKERDGKPGRCWHCNERLRLPLRIRLGRSIVMLNLDTELFSYHLSTRQAFGFGAPLARVVRHATDKNRLGLQNLSKSMWDYTGSDSAPHQVAPGKTVQLVAGTKINFGEIEGEIR
jgi:eukaryotic-like serine/threonine-protein kinase